MSLFRPAWQKLHIPAGLAKNNCFLFSRLATAKNVLLVYGVDMAVVGSPWGHLMEDLWNVALPYDFH